MEYTIEILKRNGAATPQVLYAFTHTASSIHLVRESVHSVMKSPHWPSEANGFRIVRDGQPATEAGKLQLAHLAEWLSDADICGFVGSEP